MGRLAERRCVPCHGGVPRLRGVEAERLLGELRGWEIVEDRHLSKRYKFPNFADALEFVNRAALVAEREGHHPDIALGWGYAHLKIHTHAVGGLTENDFILAAKIDELQEE
jgi:4a-hydroxytetrahydrobiopterin dehydratase